MNSQKGLASRNHYLCRLFPSLLLSILSLSGRLETKWSRGWVRIHRESVSGLSSITTVYTSVRNGFDQRLKSNRTIELSMSGQQPWIPCLFQCSATGYTELTPASSNDGVITQFPENIREGGVRKNNACPPPPLLLIRINYKERRYPITLGCAMHSSSSGCRGRYFNAYLAYMYNDAVSSRWTNQRFMLYLPEKFDFSLPTPAGWRT